MAVASRPVENEVVVLLVYERLVTNTITPLQTVPDHRQDGGHCQPIVTCLPRTIWYLEGSDLV